MPTTEQQRNYIREIQRYLRTAAQYTGQTPTVGIDGIYGNETAAAVSAFQKQMGLPVNGDVDKATFDMLRDTHLIGSASKSAAEMINGFPDVNLQLKPNMSGFEIYFLQVMIDVLRNFYENINPVLINGIYDTATQNAVNMIADSAGSTSGAQSGRQAFDAVTRLYNNAVTNL
ncbi:MAG: peptidoglycan-binding protein [Acutalibacteraceae bacterium]